MKSKNKYRKILLIFGLAAGILFTLCACGKKQESTADPGTGTQPETAKEATASAPYAEASSAAIPTESRTAADASEEDPWAEGYYFDEALTAALWQRFAVENTNETGGSGKTKALWHGMKQTLDACGVQYKAYLSRDGAHAGKLAARISKIEDDSDIRLIVVGGDGTITYTAGSDTFAGSLEVTQGTFKVDCKFMNVKATQDNPIKVTGTGTFTAVSAGNAGDNKRLPNNAYVEVDGKDAKFEVEGNNTLPRANSGAVPARIICKNGATLQANGAGGDYDVHVNEIFLDSGHVYLAGTVANYNNGGNNGPYAIRFDTDDVSIHSSGDSSFDEEDGHPNRVGNGMTHGGPTTIEVLDGTLAFNVQLSGNLIKTGAGALKIGGVKGGSAKGVIDVQAGTLIASEQLVNTTVNKTITLANETTLDISELTSTFDLATFQSNGGTLTTGEKLDLKTGSRVFKNNEKVISWNEAPACEFNHVDKVGKMYLEKRDDGLYAKVPGLIILVH